MDFSPILPPKRRKRKRCKCKESPNQDSRIRKGEKRLRRQSSKEASKPNVTEKLKWRYNDLTKDQQNGLMTKESIIMRPTFLKNEAAGMFKRGRKSSTVYKIENFRGSYAAREEGNLLDLLQGPQKCRPNNFDDEANKENITPPTTKFHQVNDSPELSILSTVSSKRLSLRSPSIASSKGSKTSKEVSDILSNSLKLMANPECSARAELAFNQNANKCEDTENFVLARILGNATSSQAIIKSPVRCDFSRKSSLKLKEKIKDYEEINEAFINRVMNNHTDDKSCEYDKIRVDGKVHVDDKIQVDDAVLHRLLNQ